MIDWLYQSTLDVSVLIVLILLIRNPIRRLLGAHISYWLWSLPMLRIIFSNKFERPDIITNYLQVPASNELMAVYSGPIQPSTTQVEIIAMIWFSGLIIWTSYKFTQNRKFNHLLQQYAEPVPVDLIPTPAALEKLTAKISFNQSAAVDGPLITGLLKTKVYLPKNFFQVYNLKQQQYIIEHELTHAKRKDLWAQFLAEIFKAVFWFNPLVHLAWRKFQQDQELACDHHVLKHADKQTRLAYGETLSKGLSALLTPNSLTFFNHKHERFIMLSKHRNSLLISTAGIIIMVIIGYVMLTKTKISFTEKNIETHGTVVSYDFKDIPLTAVAMLVAEASGGAVNFQGLELLEGIMVTAEAEKVHAFDFFDALLKDHQLKINRQGNVWLFSTP